MKFEFNEEEIMIQNSVQGLLEKYSPLENVRKFLDEKIINKNLKRLLAQQGIISILSQEKENVAGIINAMIVAIESGRKLLPYPLIENIIANYVASALNYDKNFIRDHESGETLWTIAWGSENELKMRTENDTAFISGKMKTVPFANESDYALVFISLNEDHSNVSSKSLQFISLKEATVQMNAKYSIDETYPIYEVVLDNYPVSLSLINDGKNNNLFNHIQLISKIMLSGEMVGGAEQILKETVDYTNERKQFGVPISSFQSLKHMAAEMFLYTESAKTAIAYAAWAVETNTEDAKISTLIANSYTSDAYLHTTELGLQLHGGIGFTWEHDIHLFLKRAHRSATMLGSVNEIREEIAKLILDE